MINHSIKIKKLGFTLAEVLITLAIIGVVAALTIPMLLIQKDKNETLSKVKKEYSMITQSIKIAELENGSSEGWDWGDGSGTLTVTESFDKYWAPYLKIIKYCDTYSDCGYKKNKWNKPDNTEGTTSIVDQTHTTRTTVILGDGTLLMLLSVDGDGSVIKNIYIDINASVEPNRFGRDVFVMKLVSIKGVAPVGYASPTADINSNCSTTGVGTNCLQKIIMDGWQISDNYPW